MAIGQTMTMRPYGAGGHCSIRKQGIGDDALINEA